jgi:hypothetical protein
MCSGLTNVQQIMNWKNLALRLLTSFEIEVVKWVDLFLLTRTGARVQ